MKYTDVISLKERVDHIRGVPNNLFAPTRWDKGFDECVFDRGQSLHKINLFDMDIKYTQFVLPYDQECCGAISRKRSAFLDLPCQSVSRHPTTPCTVGPSALTFTVHF
jgi:hypothetical protein